MKVLITGGAGFIGSHLAKLLKANSVPVRILDSLTPQVHGDVPTGIDWLNSDGIEFIRGSILDPKILDKALNGITNVVHLAAETGTGQSMYDISNYSLVNVQGTAVLLNEIVSNYSETVKQVLLSSSRSVYGEGAYLCEKGCGHDGRVFPGTRNPNNLREKVWDPVCPSCDSKLKAVPTLESDLICPASVYAATKYAQEDLVRTVCNSINIDYGILRLQNVYGEGQSLKNPYTGILSIFSTRIRHGKDLPIFEDGFESRDFVYVNDVVNAFYRCLMSDSKIKNVINVGSGQGSTVIEVATLLNRFLNGTSNLRVTGEFRLGDIRHNVADVTLLSSLFSNTPPTSLEVGLSNFASWVCAQPLPPDLLEGANQELKDRNLMG